MRQDGRPVVMNFTGIYEKETFYRSEKSAGSTAGISTGQTATVMNRRSRFWKSG